MTLEQFRRMQLAAKELLRLQARGHDVDALTVQWAQSVARERIAAPPPQKAYQADRVYEALQAHPPEGMLAAQIRERTGLAASVCAQTLCYMARRGQVHMLKIAGRSRYFLTKALLDRGRPFVEAEEQRRRDAKKKPPRPPAKPRPVAKPAKHVRPSVPKPRPAPRQDSSLLAPREQGVYRADMLPANVRIETLPGFHDPRFEVLPPVFGIGAVADWKERTKPLRGRK